MKQPAISAACSCGRVNRRAFLSDLGMGFTGLALGAMLQRDGIGRAATTYEPAAWTPPTGLPHFAPKAKSVIWLFMQGGTSHLESFDPKPELNKYAGKTISDTPHAHILESNRLKDNVVEFTAATRKLMKTVYPMQVGFTKRGQSGIEVSDWWPHLGGVIDDVAVIRSMWTTDNDHAAQLQFHTGRHIFQGYFPSIGSWAHYGLGSLNDNMPQFVVLGGGVPPQLGGPAAVGGDYLGPEHNGVDLNVDPDDPLPFARPGDVYREEQAGKFELLQKLNRMEGVQYPDDPALRARIKSYEMAFRMQTSVPELFQFNDESAATRKLYGIGEKPTDYWGQILLTSRRLVERGVRFVQCFHGYHDSGGGGWDAHQDLKGNHSRLCAEADLPIAGLLRDLKSRGLLDETLVVWGTEFGRTPGVEGDRGGRDHHPFGFSCWMAGGGIKGGVVNGATDELGFHAVEDRHYVTDIHATVLHQLGLDPKKLDVPGHKRLEIDYGKPIQGIIA